ncbi:LemA family protein [Cytophagaceae bacterium ABcell3]|nr:LemA family protein [Cytophagaceae bacterium ABcell3]
MERYLINLIVLFTAVFMTSCGYNSMVDKQEDVNAKWAQVENVYQRRADLIPNLVEVVKGYAAHEKDVLTGVVEARAKATAVNLNVENLSEENLKKFEQAQSGLSSALNRLMAISENYPELKANQNFLELQSQLEGTENRITVERMKFNEAVKNYNSHIRKFPNVIYAGWFNFEARAYFQAIKEGAEHAPDVKF